ncbi:peptidase M24 family protein (plasmid) [Natrialba magadii ATCC 43099]|uniref:Peptidase M24 n=1 Tax=Natrialba magadii (strain ATCC 43099 / DSM 3394 / CCM 3739 / CIP 104546 / IAM 13178 / JCM 8861 / NBRC 102185 / NCIMB 2190 / MS3) TaxID=547559 RepID=D3T1X1_NATMM|nr:M24 family metallopeptidase [Natrialba magadii]ADD07580.1 peptidase M24 family protein [Natrialba magadii ATCC 43099]ELY27220.1 peptidase M24 [Natrialba magadii ATCC 43099]
MVDYPRRISTKYKRIEPLLEHHDADAYVHVGDCFDEVLTYLTRFNGPDRDYAFVYVNGTATLCPPDRFGQQAEREFPGDEVDMTRASERPPATERARTVLERNEMGDTLLLPATAKHRTVQSFREDGYNVVLTDAIDDIRRVKTNEERKLLQAVEFATQRGMARAETVLASATVDGGGLHWQGEPLTTEILRREVNAALARNGLDGAGNTVIGAGESCADLHYNGIDHIESGETVLLDLGPEGPHGYYGDLSRTFVVGEVGEWEQRAYGAVSDALDGAFDVFEDGAGQPASHVQDRVAEELAAYGFETGDVDVGMYHGAGHGIGSSLHERPFLSANEQLQTGHVVTIEPGVYDPSRGGVRLEDIVEITEDGYENYVQYPKEIVPEERTI